MRSIHALGVSILLYSSLSSGALPTNAGTAVSFYRNKNSSFSSGQASRTSLEQKLLRVENEVGFKTLWNNKEYAFKSPSILRDIQVARRVTLKKASTLMTINRPQSPIVKALPDGAEVEILETDDYWGKVQDQNKNIGWIPLHLLKNKHDDMGIYRSLLVTPLKQRPHSASLTMVMIPSAARLIPLEVTKDFIKVQYQGLIGYADRHNFISRADFASLAYHPVKGWLPILHRLNDNLVASDGEVLPLSEVHGLVTNNRKGIVLRAEYQAGPPFRAHVEILKPEAHSWGVSTVEGHGEVWWKKESLLENAASLNSSSIALDDLLKQDIYSIAFENKNSVRGLVSSNGIFRTEDGLSWKKIDFFQNQNNPVSIHPNGTWFVGSYKSTDQGKTFQPFIRWDKLTEAIEGAYHRTPKSLRLTKIESLPKAQVQISIDLGDRIVQLKSHIGDLRWDVVRH